MQYVEIGVNFSNKQFVKDLDDVISRAVAAGVCRMIITGTSEKGSKEARRLCLKYNALYPGTFYFTAGVHPHDAKNCSTKTLSILRNLAQSPECVAIGETGLDFDRNFSPPAVQEKWFEEQVKLAIELGKPLFLHERAAHEKMVEILKKYAKDLTKGFCIHCFTGTEKDLKEYIDIGAHIGITGWIADNRRGQDLQKAVKIIPIDMVMIETDAPFLKPRNIPKSVSKRSRNEPAFISYVAKKLAECMDTTEEELAAKTTATAIKFFSMKDITESKKQCS